MLTIDLDKSYLVRSLEATIASLKRAEKAQPNALIRDLITKDINLFQNAINTCVEATPPKK